MRRAGRVLYHLAVVVTREVGTTPADPSITRAELRAAAADLRYTGGYLVKEFGAEGGDEQRRYAPPRLLGAEKIAVSGEPAEDQICTSHVERANWTLRGHLRRMTRLSNGFSRKRANLRAALALFFAYYNFCRFHGSIRMTPAMAAGIARKPWSVANLLATIRSCLFL